MNRAFIVENLTTILQILGLLCILLIVAHILYVHLAGRPNVKILQEGPFHLEDDMQVKITPEKIMKSINGTEYTMSFWLYNRNPPENANWKNEYRKIKGVINHELSPTVFFNPEKSELFIQMGYLDKDEILQYERVILPMTKQQWQHFVITIKDKNVDFYVDGVLEKSARLPNEHYFSRKNMFLGEKGNQSLLVIANVAWGQEWSDSGKVRRLYKKQRKLTNINREPDSYVEQLHKRFS